MSPRLKKITFKLVLLLFVLSMMEGISCVALKVVTGGASSEELAARKVALAGQPKEGGGANKEQAKPSERVLHPYTGYVLGPKATPTDFTYPTPRPYQPSNCTVNEHGFLSDAPFLSQETGNERVRVIITGGSVANNLYCGFRKELARSLSSLPAYSGKTFSFIGLAFEGWRQPQQLQALAYYLAQMGQADLLISVDGFNEIANKTPGYPLFPEYWRVLAGGIQGAKQLGLVGKLEVYRGWRSDLASGMSGVSWPVTLNLLWAIGDRILDARVKEANLQLAALVNSADSDAANSFRLNGPKGGKVPREELPSFGAHIWKNATLTMAKLAQAAGIRSYHFIQPSLHLPESKPLTAAENALAKEGASHYADLTRKGYAALKPFSAQLKAQGVQVFDLSGMFQEVKETLYVDSCCHFNAAGNRRMIQAMVQAMGESQTRTETK